MNAVWATGRPCIEGLRSAASAAILAREGSRRACGHQCDGFWCDDWLSHLAAGVHFRLVNVATKYDFEEESV